MKRNIGTRELITLAHDGQYVVGTYHRPLRSTPPTTVKNRVGVLFLNPGTLPRAATGDSAVYWADSLAKLGYLCFRFDLPGLGDSPGEPPNEPLNWVDLVNDGCYAPLLSGLTATLVQRFRLSGMVLIGHCSGAVSALYAAAAGNRTPIDGLVLLDPYFHLQRKITKRNLLSRWYRHIIQQREKAWESSNQFAVQNSGFTLFSRITRFYDHLKYIRLLLRGQRLPVNANVRLIACWDRLASNSVPMLVLKAPRLIPKLGEFDYLEYLMATHQSRRVVIRSIEGTTHSFADGSGKQVVRKHIEDWLNVNFPLTTSRKVESANKEESAPMRFEPATSHARMGS